MDTIREALLAQQRAIGHIIKYLRENLTSEDERHLASAINNLYDAGALIDELKGE